MIIYTNCFIKGYMDDNVVGPIAFVRPKVRDDAGCIAHVQTHIRQFWRNPLKVMLSLFVLEWKLELEVEAYKEQMKYGLSIEEAAERLSEWYGFDLTHDEAMELLK